MGKWQAIKNRLSRAVFYCKPSEWLGFAISKDALTRRWILTAGHVVTQDGTMAGMDPLGIFSCLILTAKACNESIGDTGYLTTVRHTLDGNVG